MRYIFLPIILISFCFSCSGSPVQEIFTDTYPGSNFELCPLTAVGLDDQIHPTISFINPDYNPFPVDSAVALWQAVHDRIEYKSDIIDEYQTAEETYTMETGDCEDQAILLASCLITEGYDAYVALGNTDGCGYVKHAFVVIFMDDCVYYLNETSEPILHLRYVYHSSLRPDWQVFYLFNHEESFKNTDLVTP